MDSSVPETTLRDAIASAYNITFKPLITRENAMPIFEYICNACQHRFETIVQGSTVPSCPSCKATTLNKQFSAFGVGGTADWTSASFTSPESCGSCGDPRGPGS